MVYRLQTRIINGLEIQLSPGLVKTHDAWVMGYHEHQHRKWDIQYVYHGFSKPLGAIRLTKNDPACAQSLDLVLINNKT